MRASARSSSASRTVTLASGATPSVARISSGQSSPCMAMTSSTTRSMPSRSRPRSANLAMATFWLRLSASRSSVYGLAAGTRSRRGSRRRPSAADRSRSPGTKATISMVLAVGSGQRRQVVVGDRDHRAVGILVRLADLVPPRTSPSSSSQTLR